MEQARKQEIFDTVWQAFVCEDKPPGVSPDGGRCIYFDSLTGRRCGVGLLLGDAAPRFEGFHSTVRSAATRVAEGDNNELTQEFFDALGVSPSDRSGVRFLAELQTAHDVAAAGANLDDLSVFRTSIIRELTIFAQTNDLRRPL